MSLPAFYTGMTEGLVNVLVVDGLSGLSLGLELSLSITPLSSLYVPDGAEAIVEL